MANVSSKASLAGKVCLVTGATNGIGFTTARALARLGAAVWVHGRDPERGRRVTEQIVRESGNRDVRFAQADFSRLEEVRRLAAEVQAGAPRLDVLINNAGLICPQRTTTAEGYETTFAVNHLAPFLLTVLLREKLEQSPPARIVVVASEAHRRSQLDFDDLMMARGYSQLRAYGRSKLANILFARALARRLAGSPATANALHPGVVLTNLFNRGSALTRWGVAAIGRLFMISPEQGAMTSVYLASSPEVEGRSGGYYSKCRLIEPSAAALRDEDGERLWALSAQLVGLPQGAAVGRSAGQPAGSPGRPS
ncbi:MAG: SDR family oxidoreductase [Steroidobacteraceae bacterium]